MGSTRLVDITFSILAQFNNISIRFNKGHDFCILDTIMIFHNSHFNLIIERMNERNTRALRLIRVIKAAVSIIMFPVIGRFT